jgi:hypothetical protein
MKRLVLFPILFVAFVSLACSIGAKTKSPTVTPVPTQAPVVLDQPTLAPTDEPTIEPTDEPLIESPTDTPEAVPTEEPTADSSSASGDYFVEEFDGDLSNLEQWVVAGDSKKDFAEVLDGRLSFKLPSTETYAYVDEIGHVYSDVYVEVTAEVINAGRNGIAVLCRVSNDGWDEFRVSTTGQYAGSYEVYRYDYSVLSQKKNPYINLIGADRIFTPDIKTGNKVNTIGMECKGSTLRIYINGIEQTKHKKDIIDDVLTEGTVGVGVMSFSGGPVRVDVESLGTGE